MKFVDGGIVPDGMCVSVDHVTSTFVVKITSLTGGVGPNDIIQLLQTKYKVDSCEEINREPVAMNPSG